MELCKSFVPPVQGGSTFFILSKFVVSNPFSVLEVGKN